MNLRTKLEEVRQEYLRRMTRGHLPLLREVEDYVTSHDGKMLRPRLTLLAAAERGEAHFDSRRTLLAATCVEMLHNVSLLHDDVIDKAETRRATASVNARWGNGVAVLVGDYLLAQIMQLLDEIDDSAAARRINSTVTAMVEAGLLNQQVIGGEALTRDTYLITLSVLGWIDTYLAIIDGKTARLFATAAALGNPDYEDFGLHYGRLFQLRDDQADGESTPFTDALIEEEEQILGRIATLDMQ